jgi:hypothetical protein
MHVGFRTVDGVRVRCADAASVSASSILLVLIIAGTARRRPMGRDVISNRRR